MFSDYNIWFPYRSMGENLKQDNFGADSKFFKGRAVQIISINDEKFILHEKNLKDILTHPNTKDKPVIIIVEILVR